MSGYIKCYQRDLPIMTVRVELDNMPYPIWREFTIPSHANLEQLHRAIQAVMGWCDYHLWTFSFGNIVTGLQGDGEQEIDARQFIIEDLFNKGTRKLRYLYDAGDNWLHTVTLKTWTPYNLVRPFHPTLMKFKGRNPPEDVGGYHGFETFVDLMENRPTSKEGKERTNWYGGPFHRDEVEFQAVAFRLAELADELQDRLLEDA